MADLRVSSYYDTTPVGPQDQGRFLNAVAELLTSLSPQDLLRSMLVIENELGRPPRDQRRHWGPREIDLDLLLHGQIILQPPGLTLPHPRLHERRFVLQPLAELLPTLRHPVLGQTVQQLLDTLPPAVSAFPSAPMPMIPAGYDSSAETLP